MNWQPIDTAPRDGSLFLGTGFDFGCTGNTRHFIVAKWTEDRNCFNQDDAPDYVLTHLTHWMPLPPPPENAE